MKDDLIVFEEFPGEKGKVSKEPSFFEKNSKIVFIILLTFLITILFIISSVANKKLLDSYALEYHEKI